MGHFGVSVSALGRRCAATWVCIHLWIILLGSKKGTAAGDSARNACVGVAGGWCVMMSDLAQNRGREVGWWLAAAVLHVCRYARGSAKSVDNRGVSPTHMV